MWKVLAAQIARSVLTGGLRYLLARGTNSARTITLTRDLRGAPIDEDTRQNILRLFIVLCFEDGTLADEERALLIQIASEDLRVSEVDVARACEEWESLDEGERRARFNVETACRGLNSIYSPSQRVHLLSLCWRLLMADGEGVDRERRFVRQLGYRFQLRDDDVARAFDTSLRVQYSR